MPKNIAVIIYDKNFRKVAYLENATNVRTSQVLNALWLAWFRLPANDEKNTYCTIYAYVEIIDHRQSAGLYRIMEERALVTDVNHYREYYCEHVLGTLLDTVLPGYHRTEDMHPTSEAIDYVLSFQKGAVKWVCDHSLSTISRRFTYEFENENALSALFSIPKAFDGVDSHYMWKWDTSQAPLLKFWLTHLPTDVKARREIRYKKNLDKIIQKIDAAPLATRLYVLGFGDGDNQLTIEEVNPTGLPYLDADTMDQYGLVEKIWVDRRYQNVENLYAAAVQNLEAIKQPKVTYEANAADLFALTGLESDMFEVGEIVRIYDPTIGVDVVNRVVEVERPDIVNRVDEVNVKISSLNDSLADAVSSLTGRQQINDISSQGVTSYNAYTLPQTLIQGGYPVYWNIPLPDSSLNFIRTNRVILRIQAYPYRVYQRDPGETDKGVGYLSMDNIKDRRVFSLRANNVNLDQPDTITVEDGNGNVTTQNLEWKTVATSSNINVRTLKAGVDLSILPISGNINGFNVSIRILVENEAAEGKNVCFPSDSGRELQCRVAPSFAHSHQVNTAHSHSFSGSGQGSTDAHAHGFSVGAHTHRDDHGHSMSSHVHPGGTHYHNVYMPTGTQSANTAANTQFNTGQGGGTVGEYIGYVDSGGGGSGTTGSAGGGGVSVSVSGSTGGAGGVMGTSQSSGDGFGIPVSAYIEVPSDLVGKKLTVQMKGSGVVTMQGYAQIFPLPTKIMAPGIYEPVDQYNRKYYAKDIEVWNKGKLLVDKETVPILEGGRSFRSADIDLTKHLSYGDTDLEIRCANDTRGMITASLQLLFFISTRGDSVIQRPYIPDEVVEV